MSTLQAEIVELRTELAATQNRLLELERKRSYKASKELRSYCETTMDKENLLNDYRPNKQVDSVLQVIKVVLDMRSISVLEDEQLPRAKQLADEIISFIAENRRE